MTPRFFEKAGPRPGTGLRAFQAVHIIAFLIQKRKEQNNENPPLSPHRFWRGRAHSYRTAFSKSEAGCLHSGQMKSSGSSSPS